MKLLAIGAIVLPIVVYNWGGYDASTTETLAVKFEPVQTEQVKRHKRDRKVLDRMAQQYEMERDGLSTPTLSEIKARRSSPYIYWNEGETE